MTSMIRPNVSIDDTRLDQGEQDVLAKVVEPIVGHRREATALAELAA